MAGHPNQKIQSAGGSPPLSNNFDRHRFLPKVDARGIRGQRYIQPVIHQNARVGPARFSHSETRKFNHSATIQILLPNLNPSGAGRRRAPDTIVKKVGANQIGIFWRRTRTCRRRF